MRDIERDSHRRRVIVVTTTLSCLVAIDLAVRHHDEELAAFYINRFQRKQDVLDDLADKPKIVLMGSSRAKYALVPNEFQRVTGQRTFNLAIPASKVIEWRLLAERCFTEFKPEIVVLGINASAIRADYFPLPAAENLFRWRDFFDYCREHGWSNEVARFYLNRPSRSIWTLYHRRYALRMLIQERLAPLLPKYAQEARERRVMVAKPCPADGFEHPWLQGRRLRNLGIQLDEESEGVLGAEIPPYAADASAIDDFEQLLIWFDRRRIRVMVAYLPNSPRTEARWQAVEPPMRDVIRAVCRRHGVPFLPCSHEDVPRTNADYFEECHVGIRLARRISRRIADSLISIGLLPGDGPMLAQAPEDDSETP